MKWLVWDFDGTLVYRGAASGPPGLRRSWKSSTGRCPVTVSTPELLRPFLQTGFPWHSPELHHPHLASADAWWGRSSPASRTPSGLPPTRPGNYRAAVVIAAVITWLA